MATAAAVATAAAMAVGAGPAPAQPAAPAPLCAAVRSEVVAWSRHHARAPGRAHVVSIRGGRVVVNRMRSAPADGILLACRGRAKLSNGLRHPVLFGIRAIDNQWYLFLKRPRR